MTSIPTISFYVILSDWKVGTGENQPELVSLQNRTKNQFSCLTGQIHPPASEKQLTKSGSSCLWLFWKIKVNFSFCLMIWTLANLKFYSFILCVCALAKFVVYLKFQRKLLRTRNLTRSFVSLRIWLNHKMIVHYPNKDID